LKKDRGAERLRSLRDEIAQADRFILTSHSHPDGDSIASEVALALHLHSLGKDVWLLHDSQPLDRYDFLLRHLPPGSVLRFAGRGSVPDVDLAICVDVSSWDYMGRIGSWLRSDDLRVVAIDHHVATEPFGHFDLVMEDAVSTGEIIYRYLRSIRGRITPAIAEAIYASILFDTAGFRFGRAGSSTIQLAAELVRYGIDHRFVSSELFEIETWPKVELLRLALGKLQLAHDGRLAWISIPEDLFRLTGASFHDGDGILDELLSQRHLELCALFREMGGDAVKATFRSKGQHDVGRLAQEFGGGGRVDAAGAVLPLSLHQAMEQVVPRLDACLRETPRRSEPARAQAVARSLSFAPRFVGSPFGRLGRDDAEAIPT